MVLFVLKVNPLAFRQIGKEKTVEGRLDKGMITRIKSGDTIKFTNRFNPCSSVMTKVVYIRHYRTVSEMLEAEGLYNVLPLRGMSCVQRRRRVL